MEESLKFNSQICTTKEQSERLLKLGLKPETADFMYFAMSKSYHGTDILTIDRRYNLMLFSQDKIPIMSQEEYEYIPAWSLHRLIEIRFTGDDIGFGVYNIHNRNFGSCYEILISVIEYLIKIGEFNKEYLNNESK